MSGFTINNVVAVSPVGSINGYLGNNDPPGWVIADGVQRDNTSGIYTNLYNLGVGSVSTNYYTPPNYKGAFLRGTGNLSQDSSFLGPALNTFQNMGVVSHTHGVSDPGHTHTASQVAHNHGIYDPGHSHSASQAAHNHGIYDPGHNHILDVMVGPKVGSGSNRNDIQVTVSESGLTTTPSTTGISIQNAQPSVTVNFAYTGISTQNTQPSITVNSTTTSITTTAPVVSGTYSNTETRPFNYGVNWIIKL
jgi:hypothetical protein